MHKASVAVILASAGLTLVGAATAWAQPPALPDFSGVYFLRQPPAAPPRPGPAAAFAPLQDGSAGRPPNLPPLNAEYLAKYDEVAKSRTAGSSATDATARCLPLGMPYMMIMAYGMEILQTKDKITFFGELNDALRRVYLDGRKPAQKVLGDPTYAGYSTGWWDGDTLVVDTVALREDEALDGYGAPHSDSTTIHERVRFIAPRVLEDRIVVTDPKAFTKPWEITYTYVRATPPNDELREFACAEGLAQAK